MSEAHEKVQLSIRVPADVLEQMDRIASALDRDRTWVMVRAFRQYLDGEGRNALADAEGLAALDRGEYVNFDTAMNRLDEVIAKAETRKAS